MSAWTAPTSVFQVHGKADPYTTFSVVYRSFCLSQKQLIYAILPSSCHKKKLKLAGIPLNTAPGKHSQTQAEAGKCSQTQPEVGRGEWRWAEVGGSGQR